MDWIEKPIDIISTGEILIDMIGQKMNHPLSQTKDFQRLIGGSPANVAFNLNTLNLNVQFIGSIGTDGLGEYILNQFKNQNLSSEGIRQDENLPTSIIIVSKTSQTPDFIPYRAADCQIHAKQFKKDILQNAKIFHTTCFALSQKPAQDSIFQAAKIAKHYGAELSIDLNFSSKIWPDKTQALDIISEYLKLKPLLKISQDDVNRLLGKTMSHKAIFEYFQTKFDLNRIYLTLGSQGVKYLDRDAKIIHLPAKPIKDVKDVTGAGDAFWSGFLYGFTKGFSQEKCIKIAMKLASIKLQHLGQLKKSIDLDNLLIEY